MANSASGFAKDYPHSVRLGGALLAMLPVAAGRPDADRRIRMAPRSHGAPITRACPVPGGVTDGRRLAALAAKSRNGARAGSAAFGAPAPKATAPYPGRHRPGPRARKAGDHHRSPCRRWWCGSGSAISAAPASAVNKGRSAHEPCAYGDTRRGTPDPSKHCDGCGLPPLDAPWRTPVRRDASVVLINGTLDGRTSVENAQSAMLRKRDVRVLRVVVLSGDGR